MLQGKEFQRVGADTWKKREPNRRLVRGSLEIVEVWMHLAVTVTDAQTAVVLCLFGLQVSITLKVKER